MKKNNNNKKLEKKVEWNFVFFRNKLNKKKMNSFSSSIQYEKEEQDLSQLQHYLLTVIRKEKSIWNFISMNYFLIYKWKQIKTHPDQISIDIYKELMFLYLYLSKMFVSVLFFFKYFWKWKIQFYFLLLKVIKQNIFGKIYHQQWNWFDLNLFIRN